MASWVEAVLAIAKDADNFNSSSNSTKEKCIFLYCNSVCIGCIKPQILPDLLRYKDTFEAETDSGEVKALKISDNLKTIEERTVAINRVLKELQTFPEQYPCLKGWRNENYGVSQYYGKPILFHCERAGARLLGVKQYGVHLNGYVRTDDGEYKLWIARRSFTKATYPGKLDNMVAGGIEAGRTVFQTLIKECNEEASIAPELASKAVPTGIISYCHETMDGIEPETEFMYELEVPLSFVPEPEDGEVHMFYLWNIKQITDEIAKGNFKPNCALILLQFFLNHGLITPDEEPEYVKLASCCHTQLIDS